MRIFFISLLSLLFASNGFADIFQTRDENGNIIFTDRPGNNSTEKIIKQPPIIKIKKTETKISDKKTFDGFGKITDNVKEKKALPYTSFTITSPVNDTAVRNNIGNIEVKLNIIPDLQTKFDHQIKLEYDGKLQKGSWKSSAILLTNLDRGTHAVKAYIVDGTGSKLKSSQSVEFHLQRFSRLFK